ncbi:DUF6444 domain-containing protein [Nonomuraea sp. NPDC049625]|uniref:DUF6444 domain-containing protein n=1 Tax=Nonomuraea sp. NPDC049625 TaxID=3155775 RepID=UPI003416CBE7
MVEKAGFMVGDSPLLETDVEASGLEPFVEDPVAGSELSVRVAELERRQKRNSGNSSVPPSNGPNGSLILGDVRAKPVSL